MDMVNNDAGRLQFDRPSPTLHLVYIYIWTIRGVSGESKGFNIWGDCLTLEMGGVGAGKNTHHPHIRGRWYLYDRLSEAKITGNH